MWPNTSWRNNFFRKFCCFKASQEDTALFKLYKIGQKKLDKRLNIENILRKIEDIKFVTDHYRNSEMGKTVTKFKVQHNPKKIINIDSDNETEPEKFELLGIADPSIDKAIMVNMDRK